MPLLDLTQEARQANLTLDVEALTAAERQEAISTWRARMVNEHISARVFAGIIGQMMAAGVSASKQEAVAQMISDELRHGRQCASVVYALGGEPIAQLPELLPVPIHEDASPLEGLLRNILSISCLSETIAVALISVEREQAGPEVLAQTLKTILADEVQHARFGWSLLEELAPTLDDELKGRLGDYLVYAFAHLREHELAHLPVQQTPHSEQAKSYGLCDGKDARQLFFETVEQVIIPRLEEHGLPAALAWEASYQVA